MEAVKAADTVKVRMLQGMAATSWHYNPGDVVEVDKKQAAVWLEHGIAEAVVEAQVKDTRRKPPRTATTPRPEPRQPPPQPAQPPPGK